MGMIFECANVCAHEVSSVLDRMQACAVARTCLRSFMGLRPNCRRAATTPAREVVIAGACTVSPKKTRSASVEYKLLITPDARGEQTIGTVCP